VLPKYGSPPRTLRAIHADDCDMQAPCRRSVYDGVRRARINVEPKDGPVHPNRQPHEAIVELIGH
jgi:hypothetical protein